MIRQRYLNSHISEDLAYKMVFIGGPRQVGKTTIALQFLEQKNRFDPGYLNWDLPVVAKSIINGQLPNLPVVVLDEIHKYSKWRNLVKGLYDTRLDNQQFIITGSARLDYFNKTGDSMHGRYHYYRLHPFSLSELNATPQAQDQEQLLNFGGFPEPLFRADTRHLRRWHNERITRVVEQDIRELSMIKELTALSLLVEDLPRCIGSPLSIQKLAQHLGYSFPTIARWLDILEAMYICFRISPMGSPKIRAVKKEQKLYLWDWSSIRDPGARFENMVASQLLKYCHYQEDWEGFKMELRYLRDTDKREVDFVVLKNGQPEFAVECKLSENQASKHLQYFRDRTDIKIFYQVHMDQKDFGNQELNTRVLPFYRFCELLALP